VDDLNSRGESSAHYLIVNLSKGFLAAPDRDVRMYIKQKEDDEERKDITDDDMITAENK